MRWKTIETAPKDGSDVLLIYRHVSGDLYIVIGAYGNEGPYWIRDNDGGILEDWAVTHWMPLPDIPDDLETGS